MELSYTFIYACDLLHECISNSGVLNEENLLSFKISHSNNDVFRKTKTIKETFKKQN